MAAGCAEPSPYVLMPVPGAMLTGAPMTVLIRGVMLSQIPRQPAIIGASLLPPPPTPATVWWAEPLSAMIARVLAQDLTQRLPGTRMIVALEPPFPASDTWIDLSVERFDTNRQGDVLVVAVVQVAGLRLLTRSAWKQITPANGSAQALVAALSIALGALADHVAALVVESWAVPRR
jgi:hypothetical protein